MNPLIQGGIAYTQHCSSFRKILLSFRMYIRSSATFGTYGKQNKQQDKTQTTEECLRNTDFGFVDAVFGRDGADQPHL